MTDELLIYVITTGSGKLLFTEVINNPKQHVKKIEISEMENLSGHRVSIIHYIKSACSLGVRTNSLALCRPLQNIVIVSCPCLFQLRFPLLILKFSNFLVKNCSRDIHDLLKSGQFI